MSVYQRSDGRWCAKVKDESCTPHKWIQKTFKTKQEAEQYEDEWTHDSHASSRLTVFECVLLYLKDHILCSWVQNQYRWMISGSDKPTAKKKVGYAQDIANKYVDALTRQDYNDVRDRCREGGCSNQSINLWISRLRATFNYAVREGLLERNPWATFSALDAEKGSRSGTLEQFHAVYPYLPPWLQWACRTAMALFLRPGVAELFRLKWSAFNWAAGSVRVWMGKVKNFKVVYPVESYLKEAHERFLADGQNRDLYVCRNAAGKTVYNYSHAWGKACVRAGIPRFPFYALRHICATEALDRGADLMAVAANLGHASPKTTLEAYAHAMPKGQRAAAEVLGAPWCSLELPEPIKSTS